MEKGPPDPLIGAILHDRYQVLETIGEGGMARVYRGERLKLGRPVAIKFLHDSIASNPDFLHRFELEAQAMSRLAHPHCVSVIDFGLHGQQPYLVMDYVTGETLRQLLAAGPLPVERVMRMMRQILAALGHAHSQGIVHRDIKPENIMQSIATGFGEHVRILDFGLAKLLHPGTRRTMETPAFDKQMAIGTPKYMSPEQTRAERVDHRSDIYGVGVLLVELLTGRKPFEAEDLLELLRLHREGRRPRLAELAPGSSFSPELEAVVQRALAPAPAERYQSAAEMSAALDSTPEGIRVRAHSVLALLPQLAGQVGALLRGGVQGEAALTGTPAPGGEVARVEAAAAPARPTRAARSARSARRSGVRPAVLLLGLTAFFLGVGAVTLYAWPPARVQARRVALDVGQRLGVWKPPPPPPPPAPAPEPAPAPVVAAAPAEPKPEQPAGLAEAEQLAEKDQFNEAQLKLGQLRRLHPDNGRIPYVQGGLYFRRSWFSDGLNAYRAAVLANPAYRKDPGLMKNVIGALANDKMHGRIAQFLVKDLGQDALPFLREAAVDHGNAEVRARAARLLGRLR